MTLSTEFQAFAAAIHKALSEGAHLCDPETWVKAVERHFEPAAETQAPAATPTPVPAPAPVPASAP